MTPVLSRPPVKNALMAGYGVAQRRPPDDCPECVFLPRAVERFGKAMLAGTWTGQERLTFIPDTLPRAIDPILTHSLLTEPLDPRSAPAQWFDPPPRSILERADLLLAKYHPELNRRPMLGRLAMLVRPLTFTDYEWQLAVAASEREREAAVESNRRLYVVRQAVKDLCLNGRLVAKLRPVPGGEYGPAIPQAWWRTEEWMHRFISGMMHPDHPFDADAPDHGKQWIFITEDLLARVERGFTARAAQDNSDGTAAEHYESEFMQCMRRVVVA